MAGTHDDPRECFDRAAAANAGMLDARRLTAGRFRDRERLVRVQERLRLLVQEYEANPTSARTQAGIDRLKDWLAES